MLAIARALMSRPRLLLLDEPSLGLAPLIVKQIFHVIRDLNQREKLTVFLVEQNAYHALKLAHRGYVMVNGAITMSGSRRGLAARGRKCAPPISRADGTNERALHRKRPCCSDLHHRHPRRRRRLAGRPRDRADLAAAGRRDPLRWCLLGVAVRFLHFALFRRRCFGPHHLRRRHACLIVVALALAWRYTRARRWSGNTPGSMSADGLADLARATRADGASKGRCQVEQIAGDLAPQNRCDNAAGVSARIGVRPFTLQRRTE